MIVKATYNKNSLVPAGIRGKLALESTIFSVIVGEKYCVYAQALYDDEILYLIDPEGAGRPNWYPASIFQIEDFKIDASWMFKIYNLSSAKEIRAIWGYEELISNNDHLSDLIERKESAILAFIKYKDRDF